MKTKLKLYAAAPALALIASTAMATPAEPVPTRTIIIEAVSEPFVFFDNHANEPMVYPMTITIVEEPNPALLFEGGPNYLEYFHATKEISIEVRDESGAVIFAQTHADDGSLCEFPTGDAEFNLAGGEYESGYDSAEWRTTSCDELSGGEFEGGSSGHFVYIENYVSFNEEQLNEEISPLNSIFETWGGYPTLLTGELEYFLVFGASFGTMRLDATEVKASNEELMDYFTFARTVSINYGDLDADGDGLPDGTDACPVSIMDESVSFNGWLDSGVTNYVDPEGCSVMDHYAACPTPEESSSPFGFGSRLASPTYCETSVAYDLQREGVIDYLESRILRDALYMSYRSMPR
ncbi:hypothetical protein IDAT_05470 [Pseudidiomarina atlantica]|uniref:Uncharacterized protein n=1 Tax=Pseudidiomarina atlantica TaxID=1517416 RepID=A0A094IN55_9GAMM|nr:hypothetical protein [Pseudidiomarina atlantica]KFZ29125.1 hypothetical protein IDAT_05470 [Pseudidiomarina atlantica]